MVLFGPPAAAALSPQVVAPAPFGVFHDLRWLLVYHSSWFGFAVALWLILVLRTTLDVVLTRAAWPQAIEVPRWREHLRASVTFTAVQAVVLLPFAALTFSMAVTSLSWLFYVAVPVLVMIGLLVHHGTVERTWLRDAPNRASVTSLLWAFAILTGGGAVIAVSPSWARPAIAAVVGVGIAWSRARMVHALAGRVVTRTRRQPFALVGIAAVVVLVVVGTALGFAVAVAVESGRTQLPEVRSDASGPPVLVVKGFNSEWDGVTRRWVDGRHRIARFSYAGLDEQGRPRPYDRGATHGSIRSLVHAMRRQVAELRRATGAPVSIVAESEGALIAQAYMAGTPNAPVRALVLLSPLVEPGRVHYPRLGHEGWGVVTGTVTDGIAGALGWIGPVDVSSDTPLFRSIVNEEPALSRLLRCPPPAVRSFVVLPLDSGVSAPAPVEIGFRHAVVPAFHGGLLGDRTTQDLIRAVLRGRSSHGSGFWSFSADVVNAGAAAWQAPSLVLSLEPSWDARLDDAPCRAVRDEIRTWLD
ncbi:MAG: hypothetical protein WD598_02615 [Acidimicrobiia bacterium]